MIAWRERPGYVGTTGLNVVDVRTSRGLPLRPARQAGALAALSGSSAFLEAIAHRAGGVDAPRFVCCRWLRPESPTTRYVCQAAHVLSRRPA
jgi:hypothetical protein